MSASSRLTTARARRLRDVMVAPPWAPAMKTCRGHVPRRADGGTTQPARQRIAPLRRPDATRTLSSRRATRVTTAARPGRSGRRCGRPVMRWQMGRRSDNIEDRRGMPVGRGAAVGGGIGTLLLVLVAMYFGVDPSVILQGADPGSPGPAPSVQQRSAGDDQLRDFVSVVLADTED